MATEQRLIDANARIEEIRKAYCTNCDNYGGVRCHSCWVDDGIGFLEDAPTVDAVEVVRCGECRHSSINENHPNKPLLCYMTKMCGTTAPDWFCADGERRTDHV